MTLTAPIERLVEVALQVAKGTFILKHESTLPTKLEPLARTIDHMVVGLEERDKVKNALNTFHGSAVTEDILKKACNLEGKREKVTVFLAILETLPSLAKGTPSKKWLKC